MADSFGLSFSPLDGNQSAAGGQGRSSQTPLQDAIKVLSLRIPRTVGASAPTSRALLGGAGSAGLPPQMAAPGLSFDQGVAVPNPGGESLGGPNFDLETFLRKLFGGGSPAAGSPVQGINGRPQIEAVSPVMNMAPDIRGPIAPSFNTSISAPPRMPTPHIGFANDAPPAAPAPPQAPVMEAPQAPQSPRAFRDWLNVGPRAFGG